MGEIANTADVEICEINRYRIEQLIRAEAILEIIAKIHNSGMYDHEKKAVYDTLLSEPEPSADNDEGEV